jgi:DNA (cytosine-5)-methyltransferase 1
MSEFIAQSLRAFGYRVFTGVVKSKDYGIPQVRTRYVIFGVSESLATLNGGESNPHYLLQGLRAAFLRTKGLSPNGSVSVKEAISDLETAGQNLIDSIDTGGFKQLAYGGPMTAYQSRLHSGLNGTAPNSLRLANHRPETIRRFKKILKTCRPGKKISTQDRHRLGLKKMSLTPLDPHQPAPTLTTLPDDLLHYSEPRILTVRESARLQSFPDWFEFHGKYTTGGSLRSKECPRYTQVGNAVPPYMAEAMGLTLLELCSSGRGSTPSGRSACDHGGG